MVNIRQILSRAIEQYARRNLWRIFGYPETIHLDQYWKRYKRDGIGNRVIRSYPDACWSGKPVVQDEQGSSPKPDQDDYSAFTQAWEDLDQRFKILSLLKRADRLSRVGHYSIILLGFAGGQLLSEPLSGSPELMYLATYSEKSTKITSWVTNPLDARFGMPEYYQITPSQEGQNTIKNLGLPFKVHYSRIIHIAENVDEDEVFGEPALRPIWNDLLDLEKVVGSGAETFWLNARGGLSIEANPDARMTEGTVKDMKQQVEDYENELRRTLALQGAKVSAITLTVADPKPNFDVLIQKISAQTGIPGRMLTGSERGELASSEDANSWEGRVHTRCEQHCSPNILRPFIDRMIETGNLPEPQGNWFPQWPEASALSPEKQATVAKTKIEAASAWANGTADRVLALEEVRTMIGLPPGSEYDLAEEDEDLDLEEDDQIPGEEVDPLDDPLKPEGEDE